MSDRSIDDALKGADTMDFTIFGREERAELFGAMLENMPEELKEASVKELGSLEVWEEP